MVRFFVEELSGGVLAAVKRRGENVAIILAPPLFDQPKADLVNALLLAVGGIAGGSGTAAAVLELLAS